MHRCQSNYRESAFKFVMLLARISNGSYQHIIKNGIHVYSFLAWSSVQKRVDVEFSKNVASLPVMLLIEMVYKIPSFLRGSCAVNRWQHALVIKSHCIFLIMTR